MARPVLVIFTKAPHAGRVKGRLAAGIGTRAAWRFYAAQLGLTLRVMSRLTGFEKIIAIAPDRAFMRRPHGWRVVGQGQGDLGARMRAVFRRYPGRRVVLVGGDIPQLAAADVFFAAQALKHCDAVFGPAADGGFYLVALGARQPARPFADARWSGPYALGDTLKNFHGFRVAFGRMLRDVDTAADLPAKVFHVKHSHEDVMIS
jgi:rSAM/selenodomain-associated transferase 1